MILVLVSCSEERMLSGPCTDCAVTVHPPGILDPASDEFHGKELARRGYDFSVCQHCHGQDFAGGTSSVSCLGCHRDGPTACTTCHGDGPTSNAHRVHAGASVTCGECHLVPSRYDNGHIDGVARVTFGAKASLGGAPRWDGASCSSVYCHGATLQGGTAPAPRWDDPTPPGGCDRCHGNPPPTHARNDCATCHPADAPHIDGIVQVGRTSGCSGCHGSASSPAPPTDLAGNTFTTAIGVGAHQAHLQSQLSAPIACATCHLVPAATDSPGHIDTPAPAEVVANVGWDRATQTCTASCHGPSRPAWTSSGQVTCGSCHGLSPSDASHSPAMTIASCTSCHPDVDTFGNFTNLGAHVNGVVDLR